MEKIPRKLSRLIPRSVSRLGGGSAMDTTKVTIDGDSPLTLLYSKNGTLQEAWIYGKSIQNGTPTPDAPVEIESFDGAEVRSSGKNIADPSSFFSNSDERGYVSNGIYTSNMSDGRGFLRLNVQERTALNNVGTNLISQDNATIGRYSRSFTPKETTNIVYIKHDGLQRDLGLCVPISPKTPVTLSFDIINNDISVAGGLVIGNIQIEYGDTATAYEPYKTPSVLPIPYTLRGLKVASGGNYTDSEGQQWVSDYLHLWKENGEVKGEMVETCLLRTDFSNPVTFSTSNAGYNNLNFSNDKWDDDVYVARNIKMVCSKFATNVPITVNTARMETINNSGWGGWSRFVFVLPKTCDTLQSAIEYVRGSIVVCVRATPVTTALPTSQATAMLNALKTYKPNTNIIGSKPCGLKVTYKAEKRKSLGWWDYIILKSSVDYSSRTDVTEEALANIIRNSAPTHAIVIKLSEADYDKCVSGGAWYTEISSALSTQPLVTLAK